MTELSSLKDFDRDWLHVFQIFLPIIFLSIQICRSFFRDLTAKSLFLEDCGIRKCFWERDLRSAGQYWAILTHFHKSPYSSLHLSHPGMLDLFIRCHGPLRQPS